MRYFESQNQNMRDGVIYSRVSSTKQVIKGHGLDGQLASCMSYAKSNGIKILKYFKEKGISGASSKRPALEELYVYAREYQKKYKDKKLVILLYDVSRLSRDTILYRDIKSKFKKLGCTVEYVTQSFEDDAFGIYFETMIVAGAELERLKNAERTRDKMKARVEAGYWVYGQIPIGYQSSKLRGLKEPNPNTKNIIKRALESYAHGKFKNFSELAKFLNEQKIPNHKGHIQNFDGERAKNILRWAWFYAGFVECKKNNISRRKGKHEAIITTETLELIEKRLRGEKVSPYRKNSAKFPLRGDVLCPLCMRPMTGAYCGGKTQKYAYYYCRTKGCAGCNKNIPRDDMHAKFVKLLKSITPSKRMLEKAGVVFSDVWNEEWSSLQGQRHSWGIEIEQLEIKIKTLVNELVEAKHTAVKQAIQNNIQECSERQELLKAKVQEYTHVKNDFDSVFETVIFLLKNPASIWKKSDLGMKQTIQRLVFPNGVIYEHIKKNFRKPEKALLFTLIEDSEGDLAGMARLEGENSNSFFADLEDWEAQLKPHEALLPEMEP